MSIGWMHSQTNGIFPLAAKRGMKTGGISLNGNYAFLSNARYATSPINISIYDVKSRKSIKNVQLDNDIMLTVYGVSNDGRYLQMDDSDGYGYNLLYNVLLDSLIEKKPKTKLYNLAISQQEIHEHFFPEGDDQEHWDYWFAHDYAIKVHQSQLHVYNRHKKSTKTFDLADFEGLKNRNKNKLTLSENGRLLAFSSKQDLYVYDLVTKKQTSFLENFMVTGIEQLNISNDGVLCVVGYYQDDKDIGIHWYDIQSKSFLTNSTKDNLLNITYVSQFNNHISVGLGAKGKKKVALSQFIDLCSGEFSSIVKGKGWLSFNQVQKFVKDTLNRRLLTAEEFDSVNSCRVYQGYFLMKRDYFNKQGEYEPQIPNPQVSKEFFDFIDEKDWNIEVLTAYKNRVTFQNTTGNLSFFGLVLKKKMVYFWNGNKEKPQERLVKLFITENLKPVFFSNDNYYFCPSGMSNVIGFEQDLKYYPAEQFDLKYNRPDIILDRLGYADSAMIAAYHEAYKKRLKKMGFTDNMLNNDFHLPQIEIKNFEELPSRQDQGSIHLKIKLTDSKYKLDRINIWVNDVAIYGVNGISLRDKNVKQYTQDLEISLAKGKNKVQLSVLNQAGAESYKETFEVICTAGKDRPNLYLITIGESKFQQANFNLKYAAKDAQDMVSLFKENNYYNEVFSKTLVNQQVTKENVSELKSFLQQAGINDQVIMFIAGHGVLDSKLDYYFASYDMDFKEPALNGIAYEDLEHLLDGIKPIKKILFIDACHSGEIDKDELELDTANVEQGKDIQFRVVGNTASPKLGTQNISELTKSLFTDLRKGTGATVVSSAGGLEFAIEGDEWNNGLFTFCLINGMKSKAADLNQDGEIWLSEVQQFVAQQVYELSGGRQLPTSRIENQTLDFRVW